MCVYRANELDVGMNDKDHILFVRSRVMLINIILFMIDMMLF